MNWTDNCGSKVARVNRHKIVAHDNGQIVVSGPVLSGTIHLDGSKTLQDAMMCAEDYVKNNEKLFS